MGGRNESYFLEFMYVDVARDFVGVVFHVLLDGAKCSHNHWDGCCFEPPTFAQLRFPVFGKRYRGFFFTGELVSRVIVMSMRRQVLSLFFSTMFGLLAAIVLSVWMGIILILLLLIITIIFSHETVWF